METNDRLKQMSWLREMAGDIAQNLAMGDVPADTLVDYALHQTHPETDRIELPSWFDEHDRRLLTNMVRRRIA